MNKNRKGLSIITNIDKYTFIAQLYDTRIVVQYDNTMTLNTGGFKTNHTKNCMNDLLPKGYKVYQERFIWYLKEPNGGSRTFQDGMEIHL